MSIKINFLIIEAVLVIFALSSCSSPKSQSVKSDSTVVLSDIGNKRAKIELNKKNLLDATFYEDNRDNSNDSKEPLIIDFFPSLYRSFGYIAVFRLLDKHNIQPALMTSTGFSAIIIALYAKYQDADLTEWKAYRLYNKIKNAIPFSNNWKKLLALYLEDEFKEQTFSQLKILMATVKGKSGKATLSSQGRVRDGLLESLDLAKAEYISWKGSLVFENINKLKMDKVTRLSLLPKRPTLKKNILYQTLYRRLARVSRSRETFIIIPSDAKDLGNTYIDTIERVADEIQRYSAYAQTVLHALKSFKPL